MRIKILARHGAVVLACLGMLSPGSALHAQSPNSASVSASQPNRGMAAQVTDVALAEGGRLAGQLVSEDGVPQAKAPLALIHGGKVVARAQSDGQGQFAVVGMGGGVYEIAAPGSRRALRLWAPGTAPPAAKQQIVMKQTPLVVRGQYSPGPMVRFIEYAKYPLANPLVFAGIVTTAVAVPVAIHNRNKSSGS